MKVRLMLKVIDILMEGPKDTSEILTAVNARTKFGTDMKELINVLGKNPARFAKNGRNGTHTIWGLKR